ncbi:hypothetical protein ACHHYP_07226 [Achlya hypogyna]|uniref:HTH CENPB-type domain-containing protein n=1 Tax=Achlya hypogyna TaxID=1202772 RepID=A0A1V9ZMG2_ACHHY|nr:hypothetical protein ACHHYP_07226 [Achlya hypogyna]
MATDGIVPRRPGPKPAIPLFIENDFANWVGTRQAKGHPRTHLETLIRANLVTRLLQGKSLTRHWMRRLMQRHPELSDRTSQTISRAYNVVSAEDMDVFHATLASCSDELNLSPNRLFNMDETAFDSRKKDQKVVVLRGPKAVSSKLVSTSYHRTLVACGSASGQTKSSTPAKSF